MDELKKLVLQKLHTLTNTNVRKQKDDWMKGPQIAMIAIPSKFIQEVEESNGAEEMKITDDYQLLSA